MNVVWMQEAGPGSPDEQVLARDVAEGRVLLTFEEDFGVSRSARG